MICKLLFKFGLFKLAVIDTNSFWHTSALFKTLGFSASYCSIKMVLLYVFVLVVNCNKKPWGLLFKKRQGRK